MMRRPISHPLDKLIKDDRLIMLEAMIPFVDRQLKGPLAIYIKITELKLIMNALSDYHYIEQCGLNMDMNNQEQVLSALAGCGFPDIASQFEQVKTAMNMANMMNMMNESKDMADTMNMMNESKNVENSTPASPPSGDMMENIMDLLAEYDNKHGMYE
ncbi:MAG: hypothetical protein J6L77_12135 [Coprococcus sp.]|nr:hypothetical protein [Coprococcus sp.]